MSSDKQIGTGKLPDNSCVRPDSFRILVSKIEPCALSPSGTAAPFSLETGFTVSETGWQLPSEPILQALGLSEAKEERLNRRADKAQKRVVFFIVLFFRVDV